MRTDLLRPRLSTLDLFAGALLLALGVGTQPGCGSDVTTDDDDAGSGASGGSGGSPSTTSTGGAGNAGGTGGTSTGGATATSTAVSGTTVSSTGVGGGGTGGCVDPKPVIVKGQDTGIDLCAGGQWRRREALDCPTSFPDDDPCCGGCEPGFVCSSQGEIACLCVPACTNDSECAPNELCLCGDKAGVCVSADCKTGADCAPGQECTSWDSSLGCLYYEFACTTPQDTCGGDADCPMVNEMCAVQPDGHRECVVGGCAIGRPFLVEDEVRLAGIAHRRDWTARDVSPEVESLDPDLCLELARAWERIARMEHASIAAFARFSLQLLALGAPAELVERTNQALADETKHARAAFALASAYGRRQIGPGALRMDGALEDASDLESVIRLVIREGCVGETVAAVEAAEACERACDPAVRGVLDQIASDESMHAELAWRTLQWAVCEAPESTRRIVREEIAALEIELAGANAEPMGERDDVLLSHGVVTPARREAIRRAVIERAVLPCLHALGERVVLAAA